MTNGIVGTKVLIDAATVASTATVYTQENAASKWIDAPNDTFALWYIASAAGAEVVDISIYVDVSPYSASALSGETTDTALYATESVVTGFSQEGVLNFAGMEDIGVFKSPFQSMRVRVVGGSGNSAVTIVSVLLTKFTT